MKFAQYRLQVVKGKIVYSMAYYGHDFSQLSCPWNWEFIG